MDTELDLLVRTRAPGKIILAGEHAVVYGCPALVMAVNRHAETAVYATGSVAGDAPTITFEIPALGEPITMSLAALNEVRQDLQRRYDSFAAGQLPIAEVLPDARLLAPYAWSLLSTEATLDTDLRVTLSTDIPLGCGMGSSASVGLSQVLAASVALGREVPEIVVHEISLECERLLHGHPSGVDTTVCRVGGVLHLDGGAVNPVTAPPVPLRFVNTGRPESGTGEAVAYVGREVGDGMVWTIFHAAVSRMQDSLQAGEGDVFCATVRRLHQLLCQIGVTPPRVQAFIADVEAAGGSAKVCGAGAVRGDAGGMVMVAGCDSLAELAAAYAYDVLDLEADTDGLTLL